MQLRLRRCAGTRAVRQEHARRRRRHRPRPARGRGRRVGHAADPRALRHLPPAARPRRPRRPDQVRSRRRRHAGAGAARGPRARRRLVSRRRPDRAGVGADRATGSTTFARRSLEVSRRTRDRAVQSVTRLPIDRVFSMKGFGTVVTGTLVSGRIRDRRRTGGGARDAARQGARTCRCTARRQAEASPVSAPRSTWPASRSSDLQRGQTLVTPGRVRARPGSPTPCVDVIAGARPLKHGARVRFHQGTAEILGRVALSSARFGPGRFRTLRPARSAFVRLRLERPPLLTRGDRYIMRAYSPPITIAGGLILDPRPPRERDPHRAALERVQALLFDPAGDDRAAAEQRAAEVMIGDAGQAGPSAGGDGLARRRRSATCASRVEALVTARAGGARR